MEYWKDKFGLVVDQDSNIKGGFKKDLIHKNKRNFDKMLIKGERLLENLLKCEKPVQELVPRFRNIEPAYLKEEHTKSNFL